MSSAARSGSFYNVRLIALFVLMIIVLIPGALTGAGSVSLLVVGAPVALALKLSRRLPEKESPP